MSRFGLWLLGGLSLAMVGGYSRCPCGDPEGVESIEKTYLTLGAPYLYETVVKDMGDTKAVASISGGTGQNVLQVFWDTHTDGSFFTNPQSQTLCTGPCSHLTAAMGADCLGWLNGSTANVACFQGGSWTTTEIPGDYANLTLSGNSQAVWGAYYNPTAGSYDFRKWEFGGSWDLAFTYKGAGTHWDAQFGSIEASLCATETDLLFSADEIFTGQLNYNLNRLTFGGDLTWSRRLYQGSQPTGFNPYYRSTIADKGDYVYGAFLFPPGPNSPGAITYSVNGTDGSLNYSRTIQQFNLPFANVVPSIDLFLTEWGSSTVANVVVPTPDGHFNLSSVTAQGNSSTSQLRKQWTGTPWAAMKMLGASLYFGAGSFTMPVPEARVRPAADNQATGATLTVELLTLGSFLNFAQFADGSGLSSQINLTNTGSGEETVTLYLRDTSGADIGFDVSSDQISIPGTQQTGTYQITIPPYGFRSLRTDGGGNVVVGSARVEASSSISGVIIFGGSFGLTGVGNSTALPRGFTAPMETDRGHGLNTGVALMNLARSQTTLTAELYAADSGVLVSTADAVDLDPLGQKALFVDQFTWQTPVDFSKFRGILKVTATGRIAATVLQSRPNQLATMPVTPL